MTCHLDAYCRHDAGAHAADPNERDVITNDVVEAARSTLVIGTAQPDTDRSENDDQSEATHRSVRSGHDFV